MISTSIDTKTNYNSSEYAHIMDNISINENKTNWIPNSSLEINSTNYSQIHQISNI